MNLDQQNPTRIAAAIRQNKDIIFNLWVKRARDRVEAANEINRLALLDHLPEFLENLADNLDPEGRTDRQATAEVCKTHGYLRARHPTYEVQQMLKEYRLLREAIYDVLEADGRPRLEPQIRDYLAHSIEKAMEDAAKAFVLERSNGMRLEITDMLSERQNRFVATVSHDLRSPIGTALMGLDLLAEELPIEHGMEETMGIIRRNLVRAESILKDLLDVARLKSGHGLNLKPASCDLAALVESAVDDLDIQYGQEFRVQIKNRVSGVWDSDVLRRVIDNLSTNAVKYGRRDTPVVLTVECDEKNATISVENEGEPIPDGTLAHLFEPFARSKADLDKGIEGWGIGLTFVKLAVEAHSGLVSVLCKDGLTRFSVSLPIHPF